MDEPPDGTPPRTDIIEVTITIGRPRRIEVVDLSPQAPTAGCGFDPDACDSGEVYDAGMHEIRDSHIAVNPDGTITPFRGRGSRPN